MAIAGAVVVPMRKEMEPAIRERLAEFEEVEVKDTGDQGIAIVLEAGDVGRLKEISEEINGWREVVEFNLAYLNWEDEGETESSRTGGG